MVVRVRAMARAACVLPRHPPNCRATAESRDLAFHIILAAPRRRCGRRAGGNDGIHWIRMI